MGLVTGTATFFIIWWTVLFAILPIGVRSQEEMGEVAPGTDPGAPAAANIKKKLLWTTGAAVVLWCLTFAIITSGVIDLSVPEF